MHIYYVTYTRALTPIYLHPATPFQRSAQSDSKPDQRELLQATRSSDPTPATRSYWSAPSNQLNFSDPLPAIRLHQSAKRYPLSATHPLQRPAPATCSKRPARFQRPAPMQWHTPRDLFSGISPQQPKPQFQRKFIKTVCHYSIIIIIKCHSLYSEVGFIAPNWNNKHGSSFYKKILTCNRF